jgi:REP element-mobilizing transposase RayT
MTQRRIYQNEFPYLITSKVYGDQWLFVDERLAAIMWRHIFIAQRDFSFLIFCFSTVPSHNHLIIKTKDENDVSQIMQQIKCGVAKEIRLNKNIALPDVREFPIPVTAVGDDGNSSGVWDVPRYGHKRGKNTIWQPRFNDRIIKNEKYFRNAINYVATNWQKHHLPPKFSRPPFCYVNHDLISRSL